MAQRLELQSLLVDLLGSDNVYYQPPPSVQMKYPAIVYKKDDESTHHADNRPYKRAVQYQVTVIDEDPDSEIPGKVAALPTSRFNRFYTAESLNHNVYKLFF